MLFENLSQGIIDRMNRASAAGGDKFLLAEDLDQYRRLGRRPRRLRNLEIDLIVDFAAQHVKRFQVIVALANRHELEGRPSAIESKEVFLEFSRHDRLLPSGSQAAKFGGIITLIKQSASAQSTDPRVTFNKIPFHQNVTLVSFCHGA